MRAAHRPITLVLLAALAATTPACARRRGRAEASPARAAERTVVRVENLGFPDMTIYVVRSGSERIRLGLANGNRTTVLVIPPYLVRTSTPLRFLADPIGSSRRPVSDEITVNPGDEVVLQIPPS